MELLVPSPLDTDLCAPSSWHSPLLRTLWPDIDRLFPREAGSSRMPPSWAPSPPPSQHLHLRMPLPPVTASGAHCLCPGHGPLPTLSLTRTHSPSTLCSPHPRLCPASNLMENQEPIRPCPPWRRDVSSYSGSPGAPPGRSDLCPSAPASRSALSRTWTPLPPGPTPLPQPRTPLGPGCSRGTSRGSRQERAEGRDERAPGPPLRALHAPPAPPPTPGLSAPLRSPQPGFSLQAEPRRLCAAGPGASSPSRAARAPGAADPARPSTCQRTRPRSGPGRPAQPPGRRRGAGSRAPSAPYRLSPAEAAAPSRARPGWAGPRGRAGGRSSTVGTALGPPAEEGTRAGGSLHSAAGAAGTGRVSARALRAGSRVQAGARAAAGSRRAVRGDGGRGGRGGGGGDGAAGAAVRADPGE